MELNADPPSDYFRPAGRNYLNSYEIEEYKRVGIDDDTIWRVCVRRLNCWVPASNDMGRSGQPPENQDNSIVDPTQLSRPIVLMIWSKKGNESLTLHPLSVGAEAMDMFPSSRYVLSRLLKYVLSNSAKERLTKRAAERKEREKDHKKDGQCGDASCGVDHSSGSKDIEDISAESEPASGGDSGPAKHRLPRTVVFEDRPLAEGCHASLTALGVNVVVDKSTNASPFWGFPYVPGTNRINLYGPLKEISNMFLTRSVGMLRPEANYSGFTITSGVSKHVLRHFLEISNEFRLANPWERLTPQVPVRVQYKKDPLSLDANEDEYTQPVWGVVARQVQPNPKNPSAQPTLVPSLGLFFKRYDIERKILTIPMAERGKHKQGNKPMLSYKAMKNPYDLVCAQCGKREDTDATADAIETGEHGSSESINEEEDSSARASETLAKSNFSACARCQDVFYCSVDCLKEHASEHKEHCEKWKVASRTEPHAPVRELLLVFLPVIALPMDDVDTYTSLGLLNSTNGIFPHLIAKDVGGRKAPIVESDVIHYTRVMKAILALMHSLQEDISVPVFRPDTHLNLDSTTIVYDHAEYSYQPGNFPLVQPLNEPLSEPMKKALTQKREALLPWYKNDPGAPKYARTTMAVEGMFPPSISEEYAAYREVLPEAIARVDPIVNAETYTRIQAEIMELGKTDEAWRHAMMLKIAAVTPEDHERAQAAIEQAGMRKTK